MHFNNVYVKNWGLYVRRLKIIIRFAVIICLSICFFSEPLFALELEKETSVNTNESQIQNNNFNIDKWDWRNVDGKDWTTPIRDQFQDVCGSCWAFGALGGLESNYKIWMNNADLETDLSEQYILSCSPGSCNGWYLSRTLSWIQHNGIIFENCMPYEADDTIPCESKCDNYRDELFGIREYKKLPREDIVAIQDALLTYGPLPATMEVYGDLYPDWDGGVYQQNSDEYIFGHVVTIVGFDNTWGDVNEGFWIIKNSWGPNWGEDGWFRIAFGECDIEDNVYYMIGPNYAPLKPSTPEGPKTGDPNTLYSYSSTGIDPDQDQLYILFDWGDGNDSGWLGPFNNNQIVIANYSWKAKGTYQVRIKTRDFFGPMINDYGLESDWSDSLIVEMPKSKERSNFDIKFFNLIKERFPILSVFYHVPVKEN